MSDKRNIKKCYSHIWSSAEQLWFIRWVVATAAMPGDPWGDDVLKFQLPWSVVTSWQLQQRTAVPNGIHVFTFGTWSKYKKARHLYCAKTSLLLQIIFKTDRKEPIFSAPDPTILGKILITDQLLTKYYGKCYIFLSPPKSKFSNYLYSIHIFLFA